MRGRRKVAIIALLAVIGATVVYAQGGFKRMKAALTGYEEVLPVSTNGNGQFRARINNDETEISYELTYADLEGEVRQAHIHFGQPGVNGGISAFLCTRLGNGPIGTPDCPTTNPATVTGVIRSSDVVGPTGQGIAPGELAELIKAIRAGTAYVNVHSSLYPGGEIRGHIQHDEGKNKP